MANKSACKVFLALIVYLYCIHVFAEIRFLAISDIHYGDKNKQGPGYDTGPELMSSSMHEYKILNTQVDFIITLGDFPTHQIRNYFKKPLYLSTVFTKLYENDIKHRPIFYVTGNNDSLAGNYQAFATNKNITPLNYAKHWHGACAFCKNLIIDKKYMYSKGFYSSYVMPKNTNIILIALNSMSFANKPFFSKPYRHKDQDAHTELRWLEQQLKKQHAKQLIIAMHIPPGFDFIGHPFWKEQYLKQFITLLDKYHDHFGEINLLSGHTHMSDLRKIQLSTQENIFDYSVPSISRNHYNNPAISIFVLNHKYQLQNNIVYYTPDDQNWQHYQLNNEVFSDCTKTTTLKQCLNKFTTEKVCVALEKHGFYASKSIKVDAKVCHYTYPIN